MSITAFSIGVRRAWRIHRRRKTGLCPACGYDLRASTDKCPECGRPIDPPRAAKPTPPAAPATGE